MAGASVEGAIMVQTIIPDLSNERGSSFIARLSRSPGGQPVSALMAAPQSYDAIQLILRVFFQTKGNTSADALKAALEILERPYAGVVTTHHRLFSATDHDAFTRNMIWLGAWRKGEKKFQYPEDAKRTSVIRRKEGDAERTTPAPLQRCADPPKQTTTHGSAQRHVRRRRSSPFWRIALESKSNDDSPPGTQRSVGGGKQDAL